VEELLNKKLAVLFLHTGTQDCQHKTARFFCF